MHVLDNIVTLHAVFIHLLLNRHRTNAKAARHFYSLLLAIIIY